jgi:hypothetical protein
MMSKEPSFWWSIPLAVMLWLALLWGFGFFLKPPLINEPPPGAAIDARLVELPEARPAQQQEVVAPHARFPARPKLRAPKLAPPSPRTKPINPAPPLLPQALPAPAPPLNLERPSEAAPTDMMSYVNAARARRQAEEMDAGGSAPHPSADDVRMANIRRNLQPAGTNGIFQIIDIQTRTARFSFRSWTTNASNPQRETIDVDAGPGGDIELAIIRRMIGLIRNYFKGDFNWESQRLGQVVVLSAREKDTAELEDFLKREFFGVGAKNQAY